MAEVYGKSISGHLAKVYSKFISAHSKLSDVLDPVMELFEDVKRKCLMRLEYENQMKCEAITSPSSKFYQKPFDYAMWKYAYYVCYKCKKVR